VPSYERCAQPLCPVQEPACHRRRILFDDISAKNSPIATIFFFACSPVAAADDAGALHLWKWPQVAASGRKWLRGREIGAQARFLNIANFPGLDIALQQLFQSPRTLGCAFGTLGAQEFSLVCVLHSKVALHAQCKYDRHEQGTW
jgi:hypothetical protein